MIWNDLWSSRSYMQMNDILCSHSTDDNSVWFVENRDNLTPGLKGETDLVFYVNKYNKSTVGSFICFIVVHVYVHILLYHPNSSFWVGYVTSRYNIIYAYYSSFGNRHIILQICKYLQRRVATGSQPVTAATPPTCERPSAEQNKLQKEKRRLLILPTQGAKLINVMM